VALLMQQHGALQVRRVSEVVHYGEPRHGVSGAKLRQPA